MLLFDEIPQPLIFYDRLEKQDRFKENHEKHLHVLLAQNDRLLPFQLRFMEDEILTGLNIYDLNNNIIATLSISGFETVTISEFNYYLWSADSIIKTLAGIELNLICGKEFYLRANTNQASYFSEVFSSVSDVSKYLVLEWGNDKNVDPIYFETGFHFRLIVDTFITKGTPRIEIESEEDGFGQPVDISRKVNITYNLDLEIVPAYLYEAIAFMAICNDVSITTVNQTREGYIKNITIEDDQIDEAPYWDVTVNFEQDRYYFNTPCGNEIKPPDFVEVLIDQGGPQFELDTFIDTSILD